MDPQFISHKEDYLAFELEDQKLIPHAIDQLRVLYPHLLQITYTYLFNQQTKQSFQTIQTIEKMDTKSLFQKFYYDVKNIELDDEQMKIVNEFIGESRRRK